MNHEDFPLAITAYARLPLPLTLTGSVDIPRSVHKHALAISVAEMGLTVEKSSIPCGTVVISGRPTEHCLPSVRPEVGMGKYVLAVLLTRYTIWYSRYNRAVWFGTRGTTAPFGYLYS